MSDEKIIPFKTRPKATSPRATVNARHLAALKLAYDYASDDPHYSTRGALDIRPAPGGGIFMAVVHGHITIAIHDPDGYANEPMRLAIPQDAFYQSAGRPDMVFDYCDDQIRVPLPEWAQPGKVCFTEVGMFITARMPHPSFVCKKGRQDWPVLYQRMAASPNETFRIDTDYRMTTGAGIDWPTTVASMATSTAIPIDTLTMNAQFLDIIQKTATSLIDDHVSLFHRFVETKGHTMPGVITTVAEIPGFVAISMPQKLKPARPDVAPVFINAGKERA